MSISLDEHGGAMPGGVTVPALKADQQGGVTLFGVSLAVVDHSEGMLFYLGKASLKPS